MIGQTDQIQTNNIEVVDAHRKRLDVVDILKNNTRFMIHGLLSIYPELSLGELKKMTGKSKATLVEHLKEMINSQLVMVSREEDWRGSMKKKWYSLTPEADEETEMVGRKHSDKSKEEKLTDRIEVFISFAQTKRNLLKNWAEFLECLKDKVADGDYEEAEEIMNELKNNHELYTSSSYYSLEHAHEFIGGNWKLYHKLENARRKEQGLPEKSEHNPDKEEDDEDMEENKTKETPAQEKADKKEKRYSRPYYASVDLIPIKRVFDFKAKQYIRSRIGKKK